MWDKTRIFPSLFCFSPSEQFSCGRVNLSSTSVTRSTIHRRSLTHSSERDHDFSDTPQGDYSDYNMTQLYDYYDLYANDSDPSDTAAASAVDVRSLRTKNQTETKLLPSWGFYPTLPTITEEENTDQRIVGGDEAIPGEIPWQVLLCGMQNGERDDVRRWDTVWWFLLFFPSKTRSVV